MQNNCVKFGKVSLLQGFIFFPSIARGDSFNSPSAREGELDSTIQTQIRKI